MRIYFVLFITAVLSIARANSFDGKEASLELPRNLLNQGVTQLGDLDLRKLIEKLERINWEYIPGVFVSGDSGQRVGAINSKKDKKVWFSTGILQYTQPSIIYVLSLHEAFEAAGYWDREYERSLAMLFADPQLRSRIGQDVYTDAILPLFKNESKKPYSLIAKGGEGGGVSGVGSGGDPIGADAKFTVLIFAKGWLDAMHLQKRFENLTLPVLFHKILLTSFEISKTKALDPNPIITYKSTPNRISVHIPFPKWSEPYISRLTSDGFSPYHTQSAFEILERIAQ